MGSDNWLTKAGNALIACITVRMNSKGRGICSTCGNTKGLSKEPTDYHIVRHIATYNGKCDNIQK